MALGTWCAQDLDNAHDLILWVAAARMMVVVHCSVEETAHVHWVRPEKWAFLTWTCMQQRCGGLGRWRRLCGPVADGDPLTLWAVRHGTVV